MMRSAARSKGTWVAMLVALVLGSALLVILTSPGLHPKPAQAQGLEAARATLIIDGIEIASFSKVDELTSSMKIPKAADGTGEQFNTDPKRKPMRIVLERPVTGGMEMAAWYQTVAEGQMAAARKNATLVFYDASGTPILKFYLQNAWPAEYHIEQQGTQVVERVRLTAESFQRVSPP
jgi:phage tail-like protein